MDIQLEPTVDNPVTTTIDESDWTNIQVDSQVLSIFMACPWKYQLRIVRSLRPVKGESDSIRRGLIIHASALLYWREIIKSGDYRIACAAALTKAKELVNADIGFEPDFKQETLHGFLEFLKYIQSLSWIPIEAEKYFKVMVYENRELKLRIFIVGRIDLILRTPQIPILPVDMKTEAERWFYTQMSNQFKIYNLACGTNILGVQRIGFTKLKPEEKFKMEMLPFDADILEEFRTITLPYYVNKLIECHKTDFFPMNPSNCVHGHFKCEFSDAYNGGICNVSRSVREQKILRYFTVGEPWDPSKVDE
jgi:hypothetical protein